MYLTEIVVYLYVYTYWFDMVKMCEKHLKEKEILSKMTCIFA